MSFEEAFKRTSKNEGGYSNHPADKGAETYAGISRRWFPEWEGWLLIDDGDSRSRRLDSLVKLFYRREFWDKMQLDAVYNEKLQTQLFDFGVNAGRKTAIKTLQRTINLLNKKDKYYEPLAVDGLIGSATMQALSKTPQDTLIKAYKGERYLHYKNITKEDDTQLVFISGWINRI